MHLHGCSKDLDFMDVAQLTIEMMMPWKVIKIPAADIAQDDKIKMQLEIAGFPKQPALSLALAFSALKLTDK